MADDAPVVNEPVDAGTTQTDSTPVAETTPEVADTPIQSDNGELNLKADTTEQPAEEQGEEQAPAEQQPEETQEEQPQDTEQLAPKSQNRFQQLANERNEYKRQLEEYRAREARIAREQELTNEINPETGDYYTPQEIERLAFSQSKEQEAAQVAEQRYELEVQDVQLQLRDEANRALTDFPMFDETSKDYDPELAADADELLGSNLVMERDEQGRLTGRVIGSNVSPYKIYQTVYRAHEKAKAAGQINGQRATERMLSQVDGTSSNQKGDASFDKLSTAEMAERLRRAGHDV